jgi:hypothetical protein
VTKASSLILLKTPTNPEEIVDPSQMLPEELLGLGTVRCIRLAKVNK